jgi:hypothetical protein
MFSDAKTKGLSLKDTRMTLSGWLNVLISVFASAMACYMACKLMGSKILARKTTAIVPSRVSESASTSFAAAL